MAVSEESVQYEIDIKAAEALLALKNLSTEATTAAQKISALTQIARDLQQQFGGSSKKIVANMKEVDQSLTGLLDGNGWNQVQKNLDGVSSSANKMGDAFEKGSKKASLSLHLIRIAIGAIEAMLLFRLINAIDTAFRQFIDSIRETELAINNLINTEKRLSEAGIEITPKGLQEIIDKVQELIPILSRIDAEELVSRIATNLAPALKLTGEQIEKIAIITGTLYTKNKALGYSYDEVEKAVNDAFLTGKVSQGLNKFGSKINDEIVKQRAIKDGLVANAEAFDNLTGEMEASIKAQAMINILWDDAQSTLEAMPEHMETLDSQLDRLKKNWSNLLTSLGTSGAGDLLAKGIKFIADSLEGWVGIIEALKPGIIEFFAISVAGFQTLGYVMEHPLTGIAEFRDKWIEFRNIAVDEMMLSLATATDTATQKQQEYNQAVEEFDADEFANKIEDILRATDNDVLDLQTDLHRKLEDLQEEYRRKAIDAETDYLRKVDDINRDYESERSELLAKARRDDEKAEAEYQLRLWELRMRFLMDLEDALHARDARQVLRLQKQFAIDKEALKKKKALEDKEREESQKVELKALEEQKQRKLEEARIEYEQKLADLNLAKQREYEDIQKWALREMEDIKLARERKMRELIDGWAEEQKITEENAAAVYAILCKYFGPGGMTDELYQYMMQSLLATTTNAVNQASASMAAAAGSLNALIGLPQNVNPFAGNLSVQEGEVGSRPAGGFAEGGTLIATRPTRALFGEGGPELVNFTPLNRIGKNINKIFGDRSGGGINGQIRVLVDLSPDLEGRIVEKSMDGVADVISKVGRMK